MSELSNLFININKIRLSFDDLSQLLQISITDSLNRIRKSRSIVQVRLVEANRVSEIFHKVKDISDIATPLPPMLEQLCKDNEYVINETSKHENKMILISKDVSTLTDKIRQVDDITMGLIKLHSIPVYLYFYSLSLRLQIT